MIRVGNPRAMIKLTDMVIPDEFRDFCRNFHQDVLRVHSSPEKMIASALRSMNEEQRHVVRKFLDELLSGHHSSAEIKGVWRKIPADIYFPKARDAFAFLRLVRDVMGS